jgi:hypothetical protein
LNAHWRTTGERIGPESTLFEVQMTRCKRRGVTPDERATTPRA